MRFIDHNGTIYTYAERDDRIDGLSDALDLMASARYHGKSDHIIIPQENIDEEFFDLRTGFAGEVLQKFSTYRMRLAITGEFHHFTSKALRDFITECNRGNHGTVIWTEDHDEAIRRFSSQEQPSRCERSGDTYQRR